MIKACIFDLDGTLLDTLGGIAYYVNQRLIAEGLPPISERETSRYVGHGAYDLIASTLKARGVTDGDTVARVLSEYKADYDRAPTYLVKPYDGIKEIISALMADEITVAVLSNKPDFATRSMVKGYFGDIAAHGARDGIPLKPEPDSLVAMMEELSVSSDECLFIGDTEYDLATARNAGVACVAVSWGFRTAEQLSAAGAERIISHPSELLKFIH